jgi:nucleotide-binding universal stress UspA family protein
MKVMIALDDSPAAGDIMDSVIHRQWPKGTEFFLIHVIESTTGWFSALDYEGSPFSEHAINAAQIRMHDLSMQLKRRLPQFRVNHDVLIGGVAAQIVQASKEMGVDLIILGHQGMSACGGADLGSVAVKVVQRSTCSVEVIKPKVTIQPLTAAAGAAGTYGNR